MSNYIILFDEYGSPYLAHAWLKKGETPKYKWKEPDFYGKGKHLYLYTDEEVAAFLKSKEQDKNHKGKRNILQRIKDRSRDRRGWDERSEYEEAKKAYMDASVDYRRANYRTSTGIKDVDEINKKKVADTSRQKDIIELEKKYKDAEEAYSKTKLGQKEKRKETKLQEVRAAQREKENPYLDEYTRRKNKQDRKWNKTTDKIVRELAGRFNKTSGKTIDLESEYAKEKKEEENTYTPKKMSFEEIRYRELINARPRVYKDVEIANSKYEKAVEKRDKNATGQNVLEAEKAKRELISEIKRLKKLEGNIQKYYNQIYK